jgi:accessory gene regulator protein AgrB
MPLEIAFMKFSYAIMIFDIMLFEFHSRETVIIEISFIKNRGHNFGWVIHLVLSIICAIAYKLTIIQHTFSKFELTQYLT